MTRKEIITRLKAYFDVRELVCRHIYQQFGERSWMFFDTTALETLLVLRTKILNVPLVCNNWHMGGQLSQRGSRCNLCEEMASKTKMLKLNMSAHANGCGFDLTSSKMDAKMMRKRMTMMSGELPYPIRVENSVDWLHFDMYDDGGCDKIKFFDK